MQFIVQLLEQGSSGEGVVLEWLPCHNLIWLFFSFLPPWKDLILSKIEMHKENIGV